jgi:hypothetical protein
MAYLIATASIVTLLICLAALGVILDCNVELTFHPPVFIKLKITRNRHP